VEEVMMSMMMMRPHRHTVLLLQTLAKVATRARRIMEQMQDHQVPILRLPKRKLHKDGVPASGQVLRPRLRQELLVILLDKDLLANINLNNP
jgi:hypothetical protein